MIDLRICSLGLLVIGAGSACGGPPAEAPPGPPSASAELAGMHAEGLLDPTRLACAMVSLPPLVDDMGSVLLALATPGPVRYETATSHARSVQQGMATSDYRDGAMSAASSARRAAANASRQGRRLDEVRFSAYASRLLHEAQEAPPTGGVTAYRVGDGSAEPSGQELLQEYAWLQAGVASLDPATDESAQQSGSFRARIAEIAALSPPVAETYADLLLYLYRDPELSCSTDEGAP